MRQTEKDNDDRSERHSGDFLDNIASQIESSYGEIDGLQDDTKDNDDHGTGGELIAEENNDKLIINWEFEFLSIGPRILR